MKNKNFFSLLLAIIGLSFFSFTAKGQVFVFTNGWTNPGPTMCDGEKFQVFNIGVSNNTDTAITFREFPLSIQNPMVTDSVFLLDQDQKIISVFPANTSMNFRFNIVINPYENKTFLIVPKAKINRTGTFKISVAGYSYTVNSRIVSYTNELTATNIFVQDCSPKVKIVINNNNRMDDNYCQRDKPGGHVWIKSLSNEVVKQKWSIDGKEVWSKNPESHGLWLPGDLMTLRIPSTKISVEITDALGRIGKDSVVINVIESPIPKISISANSICAGDHSIITADTTNLSKWAWNWNMPSGKTKSTLVVFSANQYNLVVVGKNGCMSDTIFTIYELPKQEKLIINSHDSLLWINTKAFKTEWLYGENGEKLLATDKQIISSKETGFYQVKATNSFGCKSISDLYHFIYEEKNLLDISLGITNAFKIYPNPAVDQFIIESNLEKGEAQLVDMQGKVVRTINLEHGSNTVYREGLSSGIYLIRANGNATRIVFL